MVRAGSLKKVISVQALGTVGVLQPKVGLYPAVGLHPNTDEDGEYGESLEVYITQFTTRASILPISGTEAFLNGLKNTVSHKIQVRYQPNFVYDPSQRIEYNGRYFDIQYILNWQERNADLTLLVIEHLYKDS